MVLFPPAKLSTTFVNIDALQFLLFRKLSIQHLFSKENNHSFSCRNVLPSVLTMFCIYMPSGRSLDVLTWRKSKAPLDVLHLYALRTICCWNCQISLVLFNFWHPYHYSFCAYTPSMYSVFTRFLYMEFLEENVLACLNNYIKLHSWKSLFIHASAFGVPLKCVLCCWNLIYPVVSSN